MIALKSKILIFLLMSVVATAQDITIGSIKNNIEMGPLAGNRDLAFGVKNILEEVLQEKNLDLVPNSKRVLELEMLYFDVKTTTMQLAIYGSTEEVTQIIAQAKLITDGKASKPIVIKGEAKSISASTLVIDKGGKFSQTNVSSALKKVCEQLIDKLKL